MHKVGKVVTREWRKAKSAELEFAFVSAFRDNSSFGLNILDPLCLWQCLFFDTVVIILLYKMSVSVVIIVFVHVTNPSFICRIRILTVACSRTASSVAAVFS